MWFDLFCRLSGGELSYERQLCAVESRRVTGGHRRHPDLSGRQGTQLCAVLHLLWKGPARTSLSHCAARLLDILKMDYCQFGGGDVGEVAYCLLITTSIS